VTRRERIAVAAVAVAGLALRLWILRTPQGALNADESYTGLQAMEILRGDVPVVFEGQAYTAVLESYVFAPFVWLFGAPIVALKLLPSVLWAVAAVLVHRACRFLVARTRCIDGHVVARLRGIRERDARGGVGRHGRASVVATRTREGE